MGRLKPRGLGIKIRRTWKINPKTRVKKSGKIYSRKKLKEKNHAEEGG